MSCAAIDPLLVISHLCTQHQLPLHCQVKMSQTLDACLSRRDQLFSARDENLVELSLCIIYAICKSSAIALTFKQLLSSVKAKSWPASSNIIEFYNSTFVPIMKDVIAKLFQPDESHAPAPSVLSSTFSQPSPLPESITLPDPSSSSSASSSRMSSPGSSCSSSISSSSSSLTFSSFASTSPDLMSSSLFSSPVLKSIDHLPPVDQSTSILLPFPQFILTDHRSYPSSNLEPPASSTSSSGHSNHSQSTSSHAQPTSNPRPSRRLSLSPKLSPLVPPFPLESQRVKEIPLSTLYSNMGATLDIPVSTSTTHSSKPFALPSRLNLESSSATSSPGSSAASTPSSACSTSSRFKLFINGSCSSPADRVGKACRKSRSYSFDGVRYSPYGNTSGSGLPRPAPRRASTCKSIFAQMAPPEPSSVSQVTSAVAFDSVGTGPAASPLNSSTDIGAASVAFDNMDIVCSDAGSAFTPSSSGSSLLSSSPSNHASPFSASHFTSARSYSYLKSSLQVDTDMTPSISDMFQTSPRTSYSQSPPSMPGSVPSSAISYSRGVFSTSSFHPQSSPVQASPRLRPNFSPSPRASDKGIDIPGSGLKRSSSASSLSSLFEGSPPPAVFALISSVSASPSSLALAHFSAPVSSSPLSSSIPSSAWKPVPLITESDTITSAPSTPRMISGMNPFSAWPPSSVRISKLDFEDDVKSTISSSSHFL
eukprot:GILI01004690.1.p1 GENE.GILI01004690.1~~GILI01004690.1.p1  ORF type:complete len:737 (+),score=73.44 GILI01004690.1:88-2211(+)